MLGFSRGNLVGLAIAVASWLGGGVAYASDHLDSPSVVANPSADIGDLYAWMDPAGGRLNLVMTIVGHTFSDRIDYVFHINSARRFGETGATSELVCRFASMHSVACRLNGERAQGDPSVASGVESADRRLHVFAALRDDPFFNNVRGARAMYQVATTALQRGAQADAAGCPRFDAATAHALADAWRHTDGGPARDFLIGWTPASIVVSIDLRAINRGGPLLGVWGATRAGRRQIDRIGRPLTANALLGTVASRDESDELKEQYNTATPASAHRFVAEIEKGLSLYDGLDGACGNQLLAAGQDAAGRYHALATMLADDRLWVNSLSTSCTQFFAVEMNHAAHEARYANDCGGRTPNYDASNIYRSLLIMGAVSGISDGVDHDDHVHSVSAFPFLAPPDEAQTP